MQPAPYYQSNIKMSSEKQHRDKEIEELQKTHRPKEASRTCKIRCKTFIKWVTKTDGMKVDEKCRFITRCNADKIFMQDMRPKNNILT